ncbi:hypothetical protein ACFYOC_15790 [Nocardiopsis alba]|uniref:hypothetical protein n=1 Tax=Nocardiopsis alba TaxID=53437 RepID=UPI0036C69738
MLSRFNFIPVFRGHWKSLSDGTTKEYKRDYFARTIILATPLGSSGAFYYFDGELKSADSLIAAVSLFAAALLAVFTLLATFRLRLTEMNSEGDEEKYSLEKDMLDESAAHILSASFVCGLAAVSLGVGRNLFAASDGSVTGVFAWISVGLISYVVIIFFISVPRLYSAYVEMNGVRPRLDGFSKDTE